MREKERDVVNRDLNALFILFDLIVWFRSSYNFLFISCFQGLYDIHIQKIFITHFVSP